MYKLFLTLIILSISCPASADIYHYVDDNGKEWFVTEQEQVPEQYRNQIKSFEKKDLPPPQDVPQHLQNNSQNKSSNTMKKLQEIRLKRKIKNAVQNKEGVQIFITDWCPYCVKLENYLKREKISYKKYDIEKDPLGKKIYQELGGRGVPVTRVGNQVIHGYKPNKIKEAAKRL